MKYTLRQAYEVMLEKGTRSIGIGFKGRLLSYRRAHKIRRFLEKRGHEVRVRYFGKVSLPVNVRAFS